MHCSAGRAPRASTAPRASSLTAAAAGAAVETIPPPRPHSSCGGVNDVTRTAGRRAASTTCEDTVFAEGGSARAAPRAPPRLPRRVRAADRAGRVPAKAGSSPHGSRSSPGMCASRSGSCGSSRRPRSGRRSAPSRPARAARARPARLANDDRRHRELVHECLERVGEALAVGGSRSRPPAATCTDSSLSVPSDRAACAAMTFVLPGLEPIPRTASSPRARSPRGARVACPVIQ